MYNGSAWCDLVPFQAWLMLGDDSRALATAKRWRRKWGSDWDLHLEAIAEARMGRTERARALADAAAAEPHTVMLDVAALTAHELRRAGDQEGARQVFLRRAETLRRSRDTADWAGAAEALYWAGRWDEAVALFRRVATDQKYAVRMQGVLGVIAARRENVTEAKAADLWLSRVDSRHRRGEVSVWRARIAAALGERERAVELLAQAFAEGQTQDYAGMYGPGMAWFRMDPHFDALREYPAFVALLRHKG
jgi:tetratricopeptide (TPR) repeat protein